MEQLNQEKIRTFYNNVENVWNDDPWHDYSQTIISSYIKKHANFENSIILNAGSAGNSYGITCNKMYHVDIADERLKNIENAVVASIEQLPFEDNYFDNIICVGSVLNYCDAMAAISELSRVLKPNGTIIIEYESSWGFEYIGKDDYKKTAAIITTEYIESHHKQWLYSPVYIKQIIQTCHLVIENEYSFHISDGIFSKFLNDNTAVKLTKVDKLLCKLPFIKNHGNNIIIRCTKDIL